MTVVAKMFGLKLAWAPVAGMLVFTVGLLWFLGSSPVSAQTDATAPTISSVAVTSDPDNGIYGIDDTIEVTVTFSEDVTVTGAPLLELDIGGSAKTAGYESTSGNTVVFSYTVVENDSDTDGISIGANGLTLNGGSISDAADNDADLSHDALSTQDSHWVDGIRPRISRIWLQSYKDYGSFNFAGYGVHAVGDQLRVNVRFSEGTYVSAQPTIALDFDGEEKVASYEGDTSGGPYMYRQISFRYEVQEGDLDTDGVAIGANAINLNGGYFRDLAGNDAILTDSAVAAQSSFRVDAVGPTITAIAFTSDPGEDDTYSRGDIFEVDVTFSEDVNVQSSSPPFLELQIGQKWLYAVYVGTDGPTVTFEYRIRHDDLDNDGISIGANKLFVVATGSIRDAAGNRAVTTHPAVPSDPNHKVHGTGGEMLLNGPTLREYKENSQIGTWWAASYYVLGPYDITWTLAGDDRDDFTIIDRYNLTQGNNAQLFFKLEPNYENPRDADGNNEYIVIVQASDGTETKTTNVLVRVTNDVLDADETPVITGTPLVGDTLAADLSPISSYESDRAIYQWVRSDGNTYTTIEGASDSSYTLTADDYGKTIKLRVRFPGMRARQWVTSVPTGIVLDEEFLAQQPRPNVPFPSAPSGLRDVASHDSVVLTWNYPYGKKDIIGYVILRWDIDDQDPAGFKAVERYLTEVVNSYTDNTVEADTRYIYRVKAVNAHGPSRGSDVESVKTPSDPASSPTPTPEQDETDKGPWIGIDISPASIKQGKYGQVVMAAMVFDTNAAHLYVFDIDVFDEDGNDADICESRKLHGGSLLTSNEYLYIREGLISNKCPEGAYSLRVDWSKYDETGVSGELLDRGRVTKNFEVIPNDEPPPPSNLVERVDYITPLYPDPPAEHDRPMIVASVHSQAPGYWTGSIGVSGLVVDSDANTTDYVVSLRIVDKNNAPVAGCNEGVLGGSYLVKTVLDKGNGSGQWDASVDVTGTCYVGPGSATLVFELLNASYEYLFRKYMVIRGSAPASFNDPSQGLPTISGTAQVGHLLTADTSGIADDDGLDDATFSYQWVANDGAADTDISGATDATYTPVSADAGKTIKVRVKFTDDKGFEEAVTSEATVAVAAESNTPATGQPTISGAARVGETLTADTSGISDADGLTNQSFSYQWTVNDAYIAAATDSTYTLVSTDEGENVKVRVTFTDDAGSEEAVTSESTAAVVAADVNVPSTGAPTISGTAQVGETLTADTSGISDVDGLDNATFTYQWLADDSDISGATNSTYALTDSEKGETIKVRVSFTDDAGSEEAVTSESTAPVVVPPPPPPHSVRAVTQKNSSVELTWEAPDDTTVTGYRIERRQSGGSGNDGRSAGGSGAAQTLAEDTGSADTGYTDTTTQERMEYRYRVSAINEVGVGEASAWVSTAGIWSATMTAGWVYQGYGYYSTATKRAGSLSSASFEVGGMTYTATMMETNGWMYIGLDRELPFDFVLELDGSQFSSADASFNSYSYGNIYKWTGADLRWRDGDTIRVQMLRAVEGVEGQEAAVNIPATGAPTIGGTAQVGEPLRADTSGISDENGLDNATFSYQWLADDADINGATGSTYTLADADSSKAIKVRVSFTDDAGNEETLTSAATAAVAGVEPAERPSTPTGLSGDTYHDRVILSWDDPGDASIDGYMILRRQHDTHAQGQFSTLVEDTGTAETTYTDDTVTPEKRYTYRIKAINEHGESDRSRWFHTDTPAEPSNPATGAPTISGTVRVGETLTADTSGIADENGLENASFSYQWLADDAEIAGATNSTYTLAEAVSSKAIKVRVSFTDDSGNEETLTSAATDAVEEFATVVEETEGQADPEDESGLESYITVVVSEDDSEPENATTDFAVTWSDVDDCATDYSAYLGNVLSLSYYTSKGMGEGRTMLGSATLEGSEIAASLSEVRGWGPFFFVELYCGTEDSGRLVSEVIIPHDFSLSGYSPDSERRLVPGTYSSEPPLTGLTVSEGTLTPTFHSRRLSYTVPDIANATNRITITPTAKNGHLVEFGEGDVDNGGTQFILSLCPLSVYVQPCSVGYPGNPGEGPLNDADADIPGFQVDLDEGETRVVIIRVYRGTGYLGDFYYLTLTRAASSSDDATLSGLTLSGVDFGTFDPATADYTASVDNGVIETMVTPTANDSSATYVVHLDGVVDADGVIPLAVGTSVITVEVTAGDGQTTRTYTVNVTRAAPLNTPATGAPTISGTSQVGETLTADVSSIADGDGLDNAAFTYQWLADDVDISGATGSSYTLAESDRGKSVKVRVSFTDDAGNPETRTSAQTAAVEARSNSAGICDRTAQVRDAILDQLPNTSDCAAVTDTDLRGITGDLLLSDAGITALQDGDFRSLSSLTHLYLDNNDLTSLPEDVFDGLASLETLDLSNNGLSELPEDIFDGLASLETLDLSNNGLSELPEDIFDGLSDLRYLDLSHNNLSALPAWPEPASNNPATGAPTIRGTAQVGETLTADISGIADADGLSGETFAYQWVSGDGTTDTDIENATGSTYTLAAADQGRSVKVRVTFTDDGGNEETLTSEPTGPVWGDGLPGAPRNLTVAAGNKEVTLSWEPPDDNGTAPATRYRIEWRMDGKDYKKGHWGTSGSTTYTKTDLANGVKYVFRVKAENGSGNSYGPYGPASEEVSATPTSGSAVDLATPVLSNTKTLHHGMVQLDWEDIEDAGWYVVQYYHVKSGEWLDLPGAGVDIAFHGSSAVVSNLHGLSWLRVRAMSCAGESEWSQIEELYGTKASDWEDVPVPEVAEGDQIEPCPVILGTPVLSNTKTLHHGMVQLDWQDIEDAGWYVVQYYHVKSGEWLDLPAAGVDIAFYGSSAVVSNLHGLSWLRVRAVSCAGESEWSQIEELYGTKASDWEGVPVPDVAEGDQIEPCSEEVATPDNSPATGAPAISGTAQVGETLTADTSGVTDADGLSNVQYEYQWLADAADISGATNATYTLVAADEGKVIKVEVSFTDDAGNHETLSSAATASVAAEPASNSPATGTPAISGTAQVGETLTADTSGVADADGLTNVSYSYQWLADDAAIAGATGFTYTLVAADEGKAIRVEVSFTDDAGNEESLTSAATDAVAAEPTPNSPATGAPTITGTAQVGETLTADASGIADADGLANATFSYQWLAGDTDIAGASGLTYTLTDSEESKAITVQVSFTDDADNEESLTSTATDAVSAALAANSPATGAPTISGTVQMGETLTANTSGIADADGLSNVQYEYRWLADDAEIAGATSSNYTLVAADEGKAIKVEVSFTDDAGNNEETLTSAATDAVAAAPTTNSPATGAPTISGTAQVGETLTANTAGIEDADGLTNISFTYQWMADAADISGATGSTYTLADSEKGKAIKVEVSFTDDAGNDESLTSAATDEVDVRPNSPATGAPTISGTAQVGETLTANTSGIADADGLANATFSYQWLEDEAEIAGATSSTYTLAAADEGKAVKVEVSFTDDGGNAETLTSAATDAVAAGPAEPPAKPRSLEATATHDSVTLTWDDPGDDSITGYVILRRVRVNNEGGEFSELVADTGSTAATYTDNTVAASTTYTYRIKAINGAGTSERSRWVHIDIPAAPVPDKPTGLSATATHDSITLTWDDPGDDSITGYVVLRRNRDDDPKGHFDELVADTGTAATTHTDDTVAAGTSYTYRIKAINEHGPGERSRWYHIDTPAAP